MVKGKDKKKVLIISHDKIGSAMAGPGIRYHYMAEVLSKDFNVTVGFFSPDYLPETGFPRAYEVKHVDAHRFEPGFSGHDIVIARWLSDAMIYYCNQNRIFMVFDLYVPGPVETLAGSLYSGKEVKPEDDFSYNKSLEMDNKFFENGDLFLFSNPRQLDFWTGYAFGGGAISLSGYPKRPIYDRFIFAPMGIDIAKKVKHSQNVIKGVIPGIDKNDKVLLWTGGIWNHFDGQVLMRAMKLLQNQRSDIKLFFLGTQHPNPDVPEMKESFKTRELSEKLGLTNKTVFFNDGWVKYEDRINYLLEADAAVNTHKKSVETEFSHRTRVLDHFLAGLPTVSTEGDYLSDEFIKTFNLGVVVPPDDEQALQKAILDQLEPENIKKAKVNIQKERKLFDWHNTMSELSRYLQGDVVKLPAPEHPSKPVSVSRTRKVAKRVLPAPAKKVIIRTLRLK